MIDIPNLTIDRDGTDPDTCVMLTQTFGGNEYMVSLHPCQVKVLAERMGILAPDAEAQRTITRLSRQLRILLDRVDTLDDWLNQAAQRGHENLDQETTYSFATWELANEFCKDLPAPATPATVLATASAPKSGPGPSGSTTSFPEAQPKPGQLPSLFAEEES
jgi:hypothetical protein